MTVQNPKDFYPRLRDLLASCGVALVLLPNLKNCGVNGAVKWLGKDKVVLALNDRRKHANTFFWNTLIPKVEYDEFVMMCSGGFTAEAIRRFAARINVLPGPVVYSEALMWWNKYVKVKIISCRISKHLFCMP